MSRLYSLITVDISHQIGRIETVTPKTTCECLTHDCVSNVTASLKHLAYNV
jgi:hypothetical protein